MFFVLFGTVAGCAVQDFEIQQPTIPPPLNLRYDPELLTLEGSCDDEPRLLENWLGIMRSIQQNLPELVNNALPSTRRSSVDDGILLRLVQMRLSVGQLKAPDCTQQAHLLVVEAIDTAILGLGALRDGTTTTIAPEIEHMSKLMADAQKVQDSLMIRFSNGGGSE